MAKGSVLMASPERKSSSSSSTRVMNNSNSQHSAHAHAHAHTHNNNNATMTALEPVTTYIDPTNTNTATADHTSSQQSQDLLRKQEARLIAADIMRDRNVEERRFKARIASHRVKVITEKTAIRLAKAELALEGKLTDAAKRHDEYVRAIKGRALNENTKVSEVMFLNTLNEENLAYELQQRLEEVEARILAASHRRNERLNDITVQQRKRNHKKSQQMSDLRLHLEQQKMERWEKLQSRLEAVNKRREARLLEMSTRGTSTTTTTTTTTSTTTTTTTSTTLTTSLSSDNLASNTTSNKSSKMTDTLTITTTATSANNSANATATAITSDKSATSSSALLSTLTELSSTSINTTSSVTNTTPATATATASLNTKPSIVTKKNNKSTSTASTTTNSATAITPPPTTNTATTTKNKNKILSKNDVVKSTSDGNHINKTSKPLTTTTTAIASSTITHSNSSSRSNSEVNESGKILLSSLNNEKISSPLSSFSSLLPHDNINNKTHNPSTTTSTNTNTNNTTTSSDDNDNDKDEKDSNNINAATSPLITSIKSIIKKLNKKKKNKPTNTNTNNNTSTASSSATDIIKLMNDMNTTDHTNTITTKSNKNKTNTASPPQTPHDSQYETPPDMIWTESRKQWQSIYKQFVLYNNTATDSNTSTTSPCTVWINIRHYNNHLEKHLLALEGLLKSIFPKFSTTHFRNTIINYKKKDITNTNTSASANTSNTTTATTAIKITNPTTSTSTCTSGGVPSSGLPVGSMIHNILSNISIHDYSYTDELQRSENLWRCFGSVLGRCYLCC